MDNKNFIRHWLLGKRFLAILIVIAAMFFASGCAIIPFLSASCPKHDSATHFCDARDGKIYKYAAIGEQIWMAENLNYNAPDSKCGGTDGDLKDKRTANCDKYGRLYNWETAKTVCPAGWLIPSNADWDKLFRFADGTTGASSLCESPTAGKYLKAANGWNASSVSGNGEDKFGFAALPGGYGNSSGFFGNSGKGGYWWSSSEYNVTDAYSRLMYYSNENASWYNNIKATLFSVRCLKESD